MEKLIASMIVGLCLFLGNISGQAKSFKIMDHIMTEHSTPDGHSHHHHDNHSHRHTHSHEKHHANDKAHKQQHSIELSFVSLQLALPSCNEEISFQNPEVKTSQEFKAIHNSGPLSFSPNIFRPPIV